ncbi:MAG: VWA domain-containing protein [Myxococcota bacterium]
MRRFLPLLALLAACDDNKTPEDTGEAKTPSAFRWSEEAGSLALNKALNRIEMERSDVGEWDTRTVGARGGEGTRRALESLGYAITDAPSPAAPAMDLADGELFRGDLHRQRPAGPLRAGSTDDNAAFDAYQTFLTTWYGRADLDAQIQKLHVDGRRTIQALTPQGAPIPGARVSIVDPTSDRLLWTARTYGDGRVPFYPGLFDAQTDAPEGGWTVQVEAGGVFETARWDGKRELDVVVDRDHLDRTVSVDVCFIIDTTGSMSDEIARVKQTLLSVTEKLRAEANQEVNLRYGAVLYRDIGDQYLTQKHSFTGDIASFDQALQGIAAGGGGDGPESLNQGLAVAMGDMAWRPGAAKVAFLIADAPPHMDYQEDIPYGRSALAAIHNGIRVHTVAASGLDDRGSLVFRQVAQLTRGKFIFIEYGSTAAAAADHGVTGPVASNNLDAILYEQIQAEIVGWGRETDPVAKR